MTPVPKETEAAVLALEGREVRVTHPDKLYFSRQARLTKLDLVRYFLSIAPGALAGIRDRPLVLKRFVDGAEGAPFYQKRAPSARPEWLRTVTLAFPSGRTAEELVVDDAAGLAFVVNLGCIELHPHPVRTGNLDHPDELRIDLDPTPGVAWADLRRVAVEVRALLEEVGLRGWPKTSGSRGMHVYARIWPRWTFTEVRRAALAFSREIERRMPNLATSKWWKGTARCLSLLQPERQGLHDRAAVRKVRIHFPPAASLLRTDSALGPKAGPYWSGNRRAAHLRGLNGSAPGPAARIARIRGRGRRRCARRLFPALQGGPARPT